MPDYTVRDPKTGRTVTMRGAQPPTGDQIRRAFAASGGAPQAPPVAPPAQPSRDQVVQAALQQSQGNQDLAGGIRSSLATTVYQGGDLLRRGWNAVVPERFEAERIIDTPQAQIRMAAPPSRAGSVGRVVGDTAQLLVPATRVAKAMPAANLAVRALAQGGTAAAVTAAQTGGDPVQMGTSAALAGSAPVVAASASAAGRKLFEVLPERLYQQIFRLADTDLRRAYQTIARGGTPNPTLARQALERDITGNSEHMAVYSLQKLDTLEQQLQQRAGRHVMVMPEKAKYIGLLKEIEERFGSGFFSRQADEAAAVRAALEKMPGPSARATDMLSARRLLDNLRNTNSFRSDPVLGPRQEELKVAADQLRGVIRKKPDLADLINEERVFIQAMDAIVDDAVRRGNRSVFGLIDAALSSAGPHGVAAAGAVRGAQTPAILTRLAQGLFATGQRLPAAAPAARAVAAGTGALARN